MGNTATICSAVGLKRNITLLLVGLDNAGKTCTVKALVGDSFDNVTPTIGFSKHSTTIQGIRVDIYDLGGGARIRDIWKNYFAEAHGVVYVIDASNNDRVSESRFVLEGLIQDPLLQRKPLLLLANKQDCEDALDEIDISERLALEQLANVNETPTRIEVCSAVQGSGKKMDPSIRLGFKWIVEWVLGNYDILQKRIHEDLAAQQQVRDKEREERRQRLRRIEEETGSDLKEIEDLENKSPGITTNPFRPINEVLETWNLPGAVHSTLTEKLSETLEKTSLTPQDEETADHISSRDLAQANNSLLNNVNGFKTSDDPEMNRPRTFLGKSNKTVPLFSSETTLRSRLPPLPPALSHRVSLFTRDQK